jgi:hypothetical protein
LTPLWINLRIPFFSASFSLETRSFCKNFQYLRFPFIFLTLSASSSSAFENLRNETKAGLADAGFPLRNFCISSFSLIKQSSSCKYMFDKIGLATEPCGVPILLTKELLIEIILDFKAL